VADSPSDKPLPASDKKLRDLRRREGQVARSSEVPMFAAFVAGIGYSLATWQTTSGLLQRLFDPLAFMFTSPFGDVVLPISQEYVQIWLRLAIPPAVLASIAFIMASAFNTKGIVINPKALSFDLNRINPAGAFKNMFGMQAIIDLIKQLIKAIIFIVVAYWLAKKTLNPSLWAPTCGQECATALTIRTVMVLIITAALLMLVFTVIDMKISKAMFLRQNRMDHEEAKRESKEANGSPEMRRERNRIKREASQGGFRGFSRANLIINGKDGAVGIAYVKDEIDTPVVVLKVVGDELRDTRFNARTKKIPIHENDSLMQTLMRDGRVGAPISDKLFQPVAIALYKAGVLKLS
jgi:type III secretion protein U